MSADKHISKPGKDVVYIDLDDEITSIIDKLENTKAGVVALVLPKRASVLQSIVNMRLLKRASETTAKNVVLITSESAILPLAGAAGLQVAKNLQSKPHIPPSPVPIHEGPLPQKPTAEEPVAEDDGEEIDESQAKIDYGRSVGELAAARGVEEPETIPLDDEEMAAEEAAGVLTSTKAKAPKDKRFKIPNFDKFRLSMVAGIGGLVLLIIFIFLATSVLPKARITLKTTSLPLSANFSLMADGSAKTLDEEKAIIPASLQTKDQTSTQTVNATGQQNNGDKAKGSVTMSGGACSATVPADVPAGSGLATGGLTYITQAKTSFAPVVSGGKCTFQSTSSTAITAQTGGSKYNVSGASFSVSGRSDVSASGSASSGTDNITTVLSQSDMDSAKQKITSADTDKFTQEWQKTLEDQDLYLITPTLKLSDPALSSSTPVGQPATTATVTVKITYTILSLKKDELKKAVIGQINKQIDSQKQKLSDDDPLKGLSVSIQSQESPTKLTLQLSIDTTAIPILDVEGIKKTAAGQKTGDIRSALSSLPGVKEVEVKFSPFWVSKAPKASKITVVQEQVNSSGNTSP
ncbi:MAG TPA: hypothetical protein VJY84_02905 [Candidatus Saccharimonadales bacterium]|nr:hypothetical protein [Candidatus Saccharimonadales bacterium]